ncbi:MAG: hypothetical protein U0T31_03125 [Chitinophagales bacterium]
MPCGRCLHDIPAAPSAPNASVFPHFISQKPYITFRVLADASHAIFFVLKEDTKNSQPFHASAQPTPSSQSILLIPFSHTLAPNYFSQALR